jgi:hypothetical protein
MVSNRTQHLPSPHSHILSVHIYCTLTREKRGAVTREKGREEGPQWRVLISKLGLKYQDY